MEEPMKDVDWWWIDYLENEMDPAVEKDLESLLMNSEEDQKSFESFRLLKEWLVGSDPIGDWPLESRLRKVRRRVMHAIDQIEDEKKRESYLGSAGAGAPAALATKSLSV